MNDETYRIIFQSWFGLTDAEAAALLLLYRSAGAPIARDELAGLIGVAAGRSGSVPVIACRLRQALDAEALDRGVGGYFLTEVGLGECRGVLWTIGEELRRAS